MGNTDATEQDTIIAKTELCAVHHVFIISFIQQACGDTMEKGQQYFQTSEDELDHSSVVTDWLLKMQTLTKTF